jgi:NADH-quinone oxidoreductase subunit J
LLKAEFLSIALVLVYVGAVMVLFLFVVMMLDIDLAHLRRDFWSYVPLASVIGAIIIGEMSVVLMRGFSATKEAVVTAATAPGTSNTKELAKLIYGDYIFAFEIAGVVLLVAIVAAAALTLRRRKDAKTQDPVAQVKVRREDRVRILSMPAEGTTSTVQSR